VSDAVERARLAGAFPVFRPVVCRKNRYARLDPSSGFETHRSASESMETSVLVSRCDAPQHEAEPTLGSGPIKLLEVAWRGQQM
jgi:hypothetical protein